MKEAKINENKRNGYVYALLDLFLSSKTIASRLPMNITDQTNFLSFYAHSDVRRNFFERVGLTVFQRQLWQKMCHFWLLKTIHPVYPFRYLYSYRGGGDWLSQSPFCVRHCLCNRWNSYCDMCDHLVYLSLINFIH